ncbi:hypothetical protein Sm713_25340 [Streptomyces sp. TS71-3]|nr:hypothetical protein Sm713_25340 [Streptomyces sp. TS71-3]
MPARAGPAGSRVAAGGEEQGGGEGGGENGTGGERTSAWDHGCLLGRVAWRGAEQDGSPPDGSKPSNVALMPSIEMYM